MGPVAVEWIARNLRCIFKSFFLHLLRTSVPRKRCSGASRVCYIESSLFWGVGQKYNICVMGFLSHKHRMYVNAECEESHLQRNKLFKEKLSGSVGFHAATSRANLATMLRPLESVLDWRWRAKLHQCMHQFQLEIGLNFSWGENRVPII